MSLTRRRFLGVVLGALAAGTVALPDAPHEHRTRTSPTADEVARFRKQMQTFYEDSAKDTGARPDVLILSPRNYQRFLSHHNPDGTTWWKVAT